MSSRAGAQAPCGLVLLRKPAGTTSFAALAPVKKRSGTSKVGHAGTLDRFARGLLVALVGPYSRLASYVQAGEKSYRGVARFGAETDTLDPEGRVVAEAPPPSLEALEAAIPLFIGTISQVPPAYSALHVNGARAYELALAGKMPEMRPREVTVRSLELLSFDGRDAIIELRCSSGTYVRSLARDIAAACGSRAHLVDLERVAIGPYAVADATEPQDFSPERDLRRLSPDSAASLGLGTAFLADRLVARFRNGSSLRSEDFREWRPAPSGPDGDVAVYGETEELLGIVCAARGSIRYRAVMASGESIA